MTREERLIEHVARALWIGAGARVADWESLPKDVSWHYHCQARGAVHALREFEREHQPRRVK